MSENTPQSPYGPDAGGPTPPQNPAGPTPPSGGPAQPPAYGGAAGEQYGTRPSGGFTVGEALGFGWKRFTGNWLFWVLFVLLTFAVSAVFNASSFGDLQEINEAVMRGDLSASTGDGVSAGASLLQLIGSFITAVLSALGIGVALREASGEKATWGALFKPNNFGMILVAALLLMAASFVGLLLCGIGLLVVAVFAVFTYHNVIDKNLNAWDAFIGSFRQVGKNFGAVFVLELALLGINIVGALLCGLGLFVTVPLATLTLAFAYRRLTGGQIATA